jgi:hypothetical protein
MCLAGVGLFAAGAAIWALPGDGGRPNCLLEVAPLILGTLGASACMAGLVGLYALLRGRARLLTAPGAFLTVGLCAPLLMLAAVAAADPSAPFGESHPCGSISVGTPPSPNTILRALESTMLAALWEVILVGRASRSSCHRWRCWASGAEAERLASLVSAAEAKDLVRRPWRLPEGAG